MKRLVCLEDYEEEAEKAISKEKWDYFSAGSCLGLTAKENIEAYKSYYILPHVLRDVSNIDTATTLLGEKVTMPIGVAPTARHHNAHTDAEIPAAKAAKRSGVCMTQSIHSFKSIEEITESCGGEGLRWMQVQPMNDRPVLADIIQRAEKANYKAIVITCDDPRMPLHYKLMRDSPTLAIDPKNEYMGNFSKEFNDLIFKGMQEDVSKWRKAVDKHCINSTTWEIVDWVRSVTSLPIVLKGILHPDDAREALKHDIQAIQVSNHGGRNLDETPPTLYALPEIIKAVNGKVEVYVDGGIRHGTDVLKALALGAKAVFVGRPIIWGLACNGEDGVYDVLRILGNEFEYAMSFAGCSSLADITNDTVRHKTHYTCPSN